MLYAIIYLVPYNCYSIIDRSGSTFRNSIKQYIIMNNDTINW